MGRVELIAFAAAWALFSIPFHDVHGFVVPIAANQWHSTRGIVPLFAAGGADTGRLTRSRELVRFLVEEQGCFTNERGAQAFADVCASNIVYEDCYEPQPSVGKTAVTGLIFNKVSQRKGRGEVRIDRISDGDQACGFAWTWTSGGEEGLRGTTFLELNDAGEIQYVREIPEPIFKPGDLTKDLLEAVTAGAEPRPPPEYEKKSPNVANELARYLFEDVQGGDIDEAMRFFASDIIYRDFNYEDVLTSKVIQPSDGNMPAFGETIFNV